MSAADVLAVLNGSNVADGAGSAVAERLEPAVWPRVRSLIEADIMNAPRGLQKTIGPSELGTDCLHCLAAKLAGWPRRRAASWLPFIGTCVHEHFERMFDKLSAEADADGGSRPYETEMRVTVGGLHGLSGGYEVTGSIDLYDRLSGSTVDWKVVGATTLRGVRAHGPSQSYLVQASLYGIGLRNMGERVERNCIFFLPRNAASLGDALPVELGFDDRPGLWALARAQMLATLMDLIEREDGADVRDAWVRLLPASATHCFDCGTWPDDAVSGIPELSAPVVPDVPDRWRRLVPLLEPTMRREAAHVTQ